MLAAGQPAPDFTLPDQDGNELTLSELRGQTVVLYFNLRADTPGCTVQACGVRDRSADHAVADAYGTWVEKSMYGKKYWGAQRATS